MNTIREFRPCDINELRKIHEKYFAHEFNFPDFTRNYLCAFTVIDDNKITAAAGIRPILEIVAVTDLSKSVRSRMEALIDILHASKFVAQRHEFDQLHAFIQNQKWMDILIKRAGFGPTKGKSVVLNF